MQIVGHRGAAGLAPENTRASFEAAIKAGADWIEFDVRATSDGHVVVFHDSDTMRTTNRPYFISRTPLAMLQRITLSGGQRIPTLTEALNTIASHAKVMIQIKAPGCAKAIVSNIERLIKKGKRYDEFYVGSFSAAHLREVKELNQQIPLILFNTPANTFRFLRLKGLEINGVGFYHRFLPKLAIEQAHRHGLQVYIFVDNARRAQAFKKLSVELIGTNRPDKLQSLK